LVSVGQAKIYNFEAVVEVQKQILGFEIPVYDIEPMNVLDSADQFVVEAARLVFW
jgi:hypothetical protein